MPITKSAKKALRQNTRRRALNLSRKKNLRTEVNVFKKLIEAGKIEEAQKSLPGIYKALDKMAKVDFIKKGKANRLKSRLTKRLGTLQNKAQ